MQLILAGLQILLLTAAAFRNRPASPREREEDVSVVFPFRLPSDKAGTVKLAVSSLTNRKAFNRHCFGFVYAAVGDPYTVDAATLSHRVKSLCQDRNVSRCTAWTDDLWSAVSAKFQQLGANATIPAPASGHSTSYSEWCSMMFDSQLEQQGLLAPRRAAVATAAMPVPKAAVVKSSTKKKNGDAIAAEVKRIKDQLVTRAARRSAPTPMKIGAQKLSAGSSRAQREEEIAKEVERDRRPAASKKPTVMKLANAKPAVAAADRKPVAPAKAVPAKVVPAKVVSAPVVPAKTNLRKTQQFDAKASGASHLVALPNATGASHLVSLPNDATEHNPFDCVCVHRDGERKCHCLNRNHNATLPNSSRISTAAVKVQVQQSIHEETRTPAAQEPETPGVGQQTANDEAEAASYEEDETNGMGKALY